MVVAASRARTGLSAEQKASASTALACGIVLSVVAILLEPVLSSSKLMTILGGLMSSGVFFCALMAVGNSQPETGLVEGDVSVVVVRCRLLSLE